nr:LytTR family DNA-binding domain-containing protein [Oscillibacter valericigenes]
MIRKPWTVRQKSPILGLKGGGVVKVNVVLEPERTDIQVTIHAPAATPEVEALAARLLVEGNGTVLGFRGAEATPLNLADILRFYGEDKEVRAQTAAGLYTVRQRLYELEERLAALRFARISHSEIVNLRQVTALDLTLTGTIRITLSDGTVCWASRRYVKRIKEVLGL